jgi:hypothetical protein
MGDMSRLMGLFAVIPVSMLLAVSFFILFAVRKAEAQSLKAFGYVVAGLLWCAALLVFSAGIYTISTGGCPMQKMMQQQKMCGMMPGMMSGKMQGMQGMMKDKQPMMMQDQSK